MAAAVAKIVSQKMDELTAVGRPKVARRCASTRSIARWTFIVEASGVEPSA
jgi:hypothetical protein